MKTSTTLLCAVVSGVLLSLAYPPLGLGFMAYGALVPMLFVALSGGPWRVFKWSFLSGSVFLGISLFWVALHPDLVWPVLILVVIVLALFYTLPFVLSSLLSRLSGWAALLVFPFAVAGFEWIRSFDQFAFPWMIIGNSQTCYPRLIQFADITSAFGISWWIAAVNVTIFFDTFVSRLFDILLKISGTASATLFVACPDGNEGEFELVRKFSSPAYVIIGRGLLKTCFSI